jgi:hypothetical protein
MKLKMIDDIRLVSFLRHSEDGQPIFCWPIFLSLGVEKLSDIKGIR